MKNRKDIIPSIPVSDNRSGARCRISVALPEELRADLEILVNSGRYKTLSDAVRAVLMDRQVLRDSKEALDRANGLRLFHFIAQTLHQLHVEVEPQLASEEERESLLSAIDEIAQLLRDASAKAGISNEEARDAR